MKILFLILVLICFFSCKKNSAKTLETYSGNGFIYTDGDPSVFAGGIGWYFAESRLGQWKAFPLKGSQLPAEYKNITVSDSIAVTVSLTKTNTAVGCDCPPGVFYYNILSIRKR